MKEKRRQLLADSGLLMITAFWAWAYILLKIVMADMQELNVTAWRFLIAGALTGLIFHKRLLKSNRKTIFHGFMLGLLLFVIYATCTYGLSYTTASNSGFLTALAVVFVPVVAYIVFRERMERQALLGILLAVIGMALMLINETLTFNIGDLLCLVTAMVSGVQIVYIGKIVHHVDGLCLGIFQIIFVALFSTVSSLIFEDFHFPTTTISWLSTLALGAICTAVPFALQPVAQKYTSSTRAALIFTMESVFTAVFAIIFLGELLTLRGYIGAFVMLTGIVVSELDIKELLANREKKLVNDNK